MYFVIFTEPIQTQAMFRRILVAKKKGIGDKHVLIYTGNFIMFFVITNIYNKKTKRPTLMEVNNHGKTKKSFFYI
jgi:hypothetical protein